jgi:hypothetical protein
MRQEREEVFLKNVSNKIRVNPLDQFYPCSKKMNTDLADSHRCSRIYFTQRIAKGAKGFTFLTNPLAFLAFLFAHFA